MEPNLPAVGAPVEPTVRRYPLDIVNAGEDTYIVMSKGHHDPHEFMRAVRAEGYEWPLGMPEHKWARAVPTRDPHRHCIYAFTEPHARGAFPATYAWEAYGEDRYEVLVAPNVGVEPPYSVGSNDGLGVCPIDATILESK